MGELAARLGLHFAIDRMVEAGAISIDQIVPLVQAYDPERAIPRRPPAPPSYEPTDAGPAEPTVGGTEVGTDDRSAMAIEEEEPTSEKDEGSTQRNLPAAGWADDAAVLLRREIPTASDALTTLAVNERAIEPIDAARRIRALWLAKQAADLALANGNDPDGISDQAIAGALDPVVGQFAPDVENYPPERYRPGTAGIVRTDESLVGLMGIISDITTVEEFNQQFASAASAYLRADVAWAAAAVCHDSTMYVDVTQDGQTDTDVAAVMTTSLAIPNTTNLDVAELRERMHPDNWPACLPTFWCKMEPCPTGAATEVVDVEFVRQEFVGDFEPPTPCQAAEAWFQPVLRFRHRDVPDGEGFELQFDLASDPIPGAVQGVPSQDVRFLVDAGAMNVRIRDGNILVRTSKVLLLKPPISAIGLTILACALGYGDMGTALLAKALE